MNFGKSLVRAGIGGQRSDNRRNIVDTHLKSSITRVLVDAEAVISQRMTCSDMGSSRYVRRIGIVSHC